jgi:hypothetical protein
MVRDRYSFPGGDGSSSLRKSSSFVLMILTSLSLVFSVVAVWVHQVVFDTDRFIETLEPVLNDQALYDVIGDEVTGSVLDALTIEDRLGEALGDLDSYLSSALSDRDGAGSDTPGRLDLPSFTRLAAPIAHALEERIDARIHAFVTPDRFAESLGSLTRRAHEVVVALVRRDFAEHPNVYVVGDEVRVNLIGIIAVVLQPVAEDIRAVIPDFDPPDRVSGQLEESRQQLAAALRTDLPDDFGQVTVMSTELLPQAQDVASLLDRYVWISVALTAGLLTLTILIAADRRRILSQLGVGVLIAVMAAALAIRQLESAMVAEVIDPRGSVLAARLVSDVLSSLRTFQILTAAAAILLIGVVYAAGRPERLAASRQAVARWTDRSSGASRLDRWVAGNAALLRVIGVVTPAALLFILGVDWVSLIVVGVLLAAYLWAITAAIGRTANITTGVFEDEGDG